MVVTNMLYVQTNQDSKGHRILYMCVIILTKAVVIVLYLLAKIPATHAV